MINFNSGTGNLFNRIGKLGLLFKQVRTFQTSQLSNITDTTNGAVAQYNAESDLQALLGGAYISQLNVGGTNVGALIQNVAQQTVNRMVFRDNPQISQTLQQLNVLVSVQEVIRQMKLAGASVLAMTITATPTSFAGTGNGALNASTKRPLDGLVLENSYAETLLVKCTQDSYTGSAVAGNETFTVTGAGTLQDFFAFDWPLGSNCTQSLSAIDGSQDNSSGNLLTNSDFEDWTANVPDEWELAVGVAGTDIQEQGTVVYTGEASLQFVGDGATATQLRQEFDADPGTAGDLDPLTQYSCCLWVRRDGTAPAAGVLTVDLADVNGVVINDANSVANSFTVDLTALTTTFAAYKGVFRTPAVLPARQFIRLRLSTPLTTGRSVYVDHLSVGPMSQMYTGGPFLAVHSGSTNFVTNDYATCAVTNSRGAAGTLSTFQTLWAQLFPFQMYGSELLLPSAAVPTISDALIA